MYTSNDLFSKANREIVELKFIGLKVVKIIVNELYYEEFLRLSKFYNFELQIDNSQEDYVLVWAERTFWDKLKSRFCF